MNYSQFKNLSCYEEFEIQCTLTGISKIDVLKEIGHRIDDYYFFASNDGIFNWFDLNGNHVKDPGILKELKGKYIPKTITKLIIPDSVIFIDNYVFTYCESLASVTISDNVTSIGKGVFYKCESLKEINIPNNVTSIDYDAFAYCKSLTSITIPDSVTSIGAYAFWFCDSLKEITIPDSVTSIGAEVFYGCDSLKEITIHDSVTHIGAYAFIECKSLKEVIFKGKTLEEVKQMDNYPFGIKDESIIKCV